VEADGKFLRAGGQRFLIRGVTYGTFAPNGAGRQFPEPSRIAADFRMMAGLGVNTVRTYTAPGRDLLDEAARNGLRVLVGLPWAEHVAFLDDRALQRKIRRDLADAVGTLGDHPAVLAFAVGNEIPPGVVRWHGRARVEHFIHNLYRDLKAVSPDSLLTYVNFPPTEFLDLPFFDICAFNVYLHEERALDAYLARLQHVAGHRPLLLAEAGADSIREGVDGQARITAMHVRRAFEAGAAGAIAFAWTDEWWRGGAAVDDWAFGLVTRDRDLKPAAIAVADAFDRAPFDDEQQRKWPRVSVVVCAYNAESTLEDCLGSLERLSYPDYEIIVVNDGSRDRTSQLAHAHAHVRVIDLPNGGLSAARNAGLAEATGEIVAYTDADVRTDIDWLTFLVQPFLTSDVVAAGGPNVVPPDDPPMAQCIARAPGGPTHVLIDDRIAEHVPGCNMAFRRDKLLAIGGFNPVYLRAGDDVDVCWRLQAQGWRIGFAASALVWHHHRASVRAYWRQQVGYGEGEAWLMAHHPEKFLDGHMLWHGRIYSPLPFVRSLSATRINAGVWGTAPFPSIYRTDVHPFAFLPHSIRWQLFSTLLTLAGALVAATGDHGWAAALLLGSGLIGLATTVAKNIAYAMRSDVDGLLRRSGRARPAWRRALTAGWYRATVAYLHFIQPIARLAGRVRGALSPPTLIAPPAQTSRGPTPTIREAFRALLLLSGSITEDRFWSESWTSAERSLSRLTDWLRRSRAVHTIDVDEGWSHDRDVSVAVSRWAWLDIRAMTEDHGAGRTLLRVGTHLRPTTFGTLAAIVLGLSLLGGVLFGVALRWPAVGATTAGLAVVVIAFAAWRTAQVTAILRRAVNRVAADQQMIRIGSGPIRGPLLAPALLRTYGLRSAMVFVIAIVAVGSGTLMLREAATAAVIGQKKGFAGDNGPAIQAWLDAPGGIAITQAGDVYFADSNNHVIRRIDPRNGVITTVVGNHQLGPGFSGDLGPASKARLDHPDGVSIAPNGDLVIADSHNDRIRRVDRKTGIVTTIAGTGEGAFSGDEGPATQAALYSPSAAVVAPNGDVYIADTLNYRVRRIDHATGIITTVAGDGSPGEEEEGPVGDGGPATAAHLNMPSDVAVAPNGDIYIADMYHNRIRRVDARTGIISTVAGSGYWGYWGDGGAATASALAGPAGIALASAADGALTLFVADYYNGVVRAVGPDGVIRDVTGNSRTTFGAPTRVAFAKAGPRRGWLYVSDSGNDRIVPLNIREIAPQLVPPAANARKVGP
jgi:GT2 family glycosyltransferase/sugar lactone lactonase YvrE